MNNLELLRCYHFDKKIRLGQNGDGGYVLGDLEGGYDLYISAGVSDEESFSRDFINKYNMDYNNSVAFDGTIEKYPYNYTKNITFIKKNINSFKDEKNANLSYFTDNYNNIFLKMDIEGGEYPWLLSISEEQLSKFKQIVFEFHGINDDTFNYSYDDKGKCLEKLSNTHYLIHVHGNNFSSVTNNIPDVIELTYINKKCCINVPEFNKEPLPINNLDYPNFSIKNDIDLNFYPFVNL
jgi:hypothetical protein